MKKILKYFLFVVVFLIGIKGVKADRVNLVKEYVDDVWSFHYRNGYIWTYGLLQKDYADDKLVYCIQPDSSVNTSEYYEYSDFSLSGYSDVEKYQMELISYYGYNYPGHYSLKYFMATQELLWLFSDDEYITWNTSEYQDGDNIDISYEKSEIMRLVNNHNKKPSFYGNEINASSSSIELIDYNNVLDNYYIEAPNDITYSIEGNKLKITSNKIGTYQLNFMKNRYYYPNTILYNNESLSTQKLALFKEPYIENFTITVNFNKVRVDIFKRDKDTNELIKDNGIKIRIRNLNSGELIDDTYEFVSGKIGISLPIGKYKIEEVNAPDGYYINEEGLEFEITEDDFDRKELEFYNSKVKGKINLYKQNEIGEYLSGVKFDIYDGDNNIVDTIETIDGIAYSKELELGNYNVKEKENIYGYEPNNDIYEINLSYKDQNTSIVLEDLYVINNRIKCDIVFISTSDDMNIDVGFNIYSNGEIIYSGYTKDGRAEIELPYGEYVLRETSVPGGYLLNEEEINFSVNDITCNSLLKINNEKIEMPITSSESNIFYLITLLINISSYAFYKKNK